MEWWVWPVICGVSVAAGLVMGYALGYNARDRKWR